MISYEQKKYWKFLLLLFAVFISIGSLIYTNILVKELQADQYRTVNTLADAYKNINKSLLEGKAEDISFLFQIVMSNQNIPLILTDTNNNILEHRNLDKNKINKKNFLEDQLSIMKAKHHPIPINYSPGNRHLIYYKDSRLITQLTFYPYIQLFLVLLFIIIAYFAFNNSRKYEQNKVWTGMSKETAHQLGTPVSSLIALKENIKLSNGQISNELIDMFEKDTERLELITDRFSKIGSIPKPEMVTVYESISNTVRYLTLRISKKVLIRFTPETDQTIKVPLIPSLFDWVIENLCKNAINAMDGDGVITISISDAGKYVHIDINDTGKGISKYKYKTIFKAGYTTNKRGWGLGLSLSKRIIEEFHRGEIFVKWSEALKGTTFRIRLRKKISSIRLVQ